MEAAGYLFCVEVAPTDRRSRIQLGVHDDQLVATVTGDLDGGSEIGRSDGTAMFAAWQHSGDRVAALDGEMHAKRHDVGLTVTAVIPLHPPPGADPATTTQHPTSPGPSVD